VRLAAHRGEKHIRLQGPRAIVTAQARSLAQELGLVFEEGAALVSDAAPGHSGVIDHEAVRRVIEAQTHGPASEAVMQEVLRRIAQEGAPALPLAAPQTPTVRKITALCPSPKTSASSVNVSQLDLTSLDLTQAAPCASGFMGWSKNTFPFNRDSDELNLVLEGELQFHVGDAVISASAGDVMWVPKGSQGKIGTPTSVRYFYLSYPA
jgi:ethanolamine utilization protein EutQ